MAIVTSHIYGIPLVHSDHKQKPKYENFLGTDHDVQKLIHIIKNKYLSNNSGKSTLLANRYVRYLSAFPT